MKIDGVIKLLKTECKGAGSVTEWAKTHDFSDAYVHYILDGKRLPGPKFLAKLGLVKVVDYQRVEK